MKVSDGRGGEEEEDDLMGTLKWKLQIIHALLFLQTSYFITLHFAMAYK
jgi:hypothetical protein